MPYYSDTDPKIEKLQFDLVRQIPTSKKLMMVASLNQAVLDLAWSGLRAHYPHKSTARLRRRLADRMLGTELAQKAFGPHKEKEKHAG